MFQPLVSILRRPAILRPEAIRSALAGLVVSALTFALCGLGFETGMRILERGSIPFYEAHPTLGFVQKRSFDGHHFFGERVSINSKRLRDLERTYARPRHVERRVLVLGDSHAWGTGVQREETLAAQMETRLEGTEVINAAVSAYDTYQQYVYLRDEGLRYSPDVIVLAFCDNDLDGVRDSDSLRTQFNPSTFGPLVWLRDNSYAYGWAKNHFEAVRSRFDAERRLGQASTEADREQAWVVFEDLLGRIQTLAEANGAKLVVGPIPSRGTVEAGAGRTQYARLAKLTERLGATYVDTVTPFMTDASDGATYYLDGDHHIDNEGHAKYAEVVAETLRVPSAELAVAR